MDEDNKEHPFDKTVTRRTFLKAAALALAASQFSGERVVDKPRMQDNKNRAELVAEINAMSLEELETEVYKKQSVIPDSAPIADRLSEITRIEEDSVIMNVGTSVGRMSLDSVFGDGIDPREVDFGEEQDKYELFLQYFRIPEGMREACTIEMIDIWDLINSPSSCQRSNSDMHCEPGVSVVDNYINQFDPKVAINFIGTAYVRSKLDLETFAWAVEDALDHYISKGVIPVLTTFPQPPNSDEEPYKSWFSDPKIIVHPGQTVEKVREETIDYRSSMLPENALKYNVMLIKLAEIYQIPIINLQRGVVESAENNGTAVPGPYFYSDEIDPEHFSSTHRYLTPLKVPTDGSKFESGEQAASYFIVQTLCDMVANQSES